MTRVDTPLDDIEDRLHDLQAARPPAGLPPVDALARRGAQRRRRRRSAGAVALVALVGAGGAVAPAARWSGDSAEVATAPETATSAPTGMAPDGDRSRPLAMPHVVGFDVTAASRELDELGLEIRVTLTSDRHDMGPVLSQDPAPGTILHPGDQVELITGRRVVRVEGPEIQGLLHDGTRWSVTLDDTRGLCARLGSGALQCDGISVRPIVPPSATPRLALAPGSPSFEAWSLVYAFLPAGATRVELVYDDRTVDAQAVIEPDERFWGASLDPADNPETIVYRDHAGGEIARIPLRSE